MHLFMNCSFIRALQSLSRSPLSIILRHSLTRLNEMPVDEDVLIFVMILVVNAHLVYVVYNCLF